jgi:hypothetical protein
MAIDANESLDTSNQHFQEWIAECRLISAHENFYDEEYYDNNKIPTTHQNGSTKIDHVFCTPRLFGCITGVAIEPLHDGIFSDHHTLIVNFDTGQLLGHATHIAKPKTRLLTSTQKTPIHQYRTALDNKLRAQNVYTRVTKLLAKYSTTKPPTQWMEDQTETLDQYITDCMLSAEDSPTQPG